MRKEHAAGLRSSRVRVVSEVPTDYERYAAEWGYALNAEAGEEIRIWHLADHPLPADVVTQDFWLVGDDHVLVMNYDEAGRFEGASVPGRDVIRGCRHTRDILWAGAEPFESWWGRHLELRRPQPA